MIITKTSKHFEVAFSFNPQVKEEVKAVPGARWDFMRKIWTVPLYSNSYIDRLRKKYCQNDTKPEIIMDIIPLPELTISIPSRLQPFPYQKQGVAYAIQKRKCIFGDQPGLGKTGQAILASIGVGAKCILIICPATLKDNWRVEFEKWVGRKSLILTDRVKTTWQQYYKVGMVNVFICNYESLQKYFVKEIKIHLDEEGKKKPLALNHIIFNESINLFDTLIIDESHRVKDGKTKTTKFCMGISRGMTNIFALTGTPLVNTPKDLVSQLNIIHHLKATFGGYKSFVDRYCEDGGSNLKELNAKLLNNCFFRREKKDVLKDLPDKMRNIVRCEITNREEYTKAENDFKEFLKKSGYTAGQIDKSLRAEVLVKMMLLKKLSARGKFEEALEHINEVVEAGEKIVVFAHHKEIVNELRSHIPGAVTIVGDDSMDQRKAAVYAFQKCKVCGIKLDDHKDESHDYELSETQVIICNIKSGGVGITLTASSRVSFIELPWHPADCDQCEDRCHRIGQKDSVQATYFLGHNTIDEYIYSIIEKKRNIANQVTGAKEEIETNMVDEFLNLFMKEKL